MICTGMAFVPGDSMFQLHEDNHLSSTSPNLLSSSCGPQDFQGVSSLMMRRSMSFSGVDRCDQEMRVHDNDDMSDDGCALGEKKRRLNIEQVRALEKSFEVGNKLEPERKMQLARALGLQPRQIAIWFQNRRARWKTKQLERDYDILKKQFDALRADNDALKTHNQKLLSELMAMKNREPSGIGAINLNKENIEGSWSNGSENSIDVNIAGTITRTTSSDSPPLYPHQPSTSLTQLLQCPKIDHHQDEGFCNMFNNIHEEQPNFWPWPEQQHFQ